MPFSKEYIDLNLQDANIKYYPSFFNKEISDYYFERLKQNIKWQHDSITLFGKTHLQPRLTALYGNNEKSYTYSNITMHPKIFTKDLLKIKEFVEKHLKVKFTSCLANLYRDGQDSNGWHADDEKELCEEPIIASVSFGTERVFHFKHKLDKNLKIKLVLEHGSLLMMKGTTQKFWLHQLPKTKRKIGSRINLTFRIIQ
ncbi:MAG TPA: alpha-ketoglutarate-dependent dioxygenase AlkB [Flavobacteriaceae bacterium]|nr:alpha-ketoglutarate-dependent dioxygenase AlkB [Flavobacteriaceae bacterium]